MRKIYGNDNVIASDIRNTTKEEFQPFEVLDVLDENNFINIIKKHNIGTIYHLAAILSANGEKNIDLCWNININGLNNVLKIGYELKLEKIICPSSIAVFGPEAPKNNTPQETILLPKTMYGITKVSGELLCDYYVNKFNLDVRGVRYPGLISSKTLPGGGTTDYAVEIFYEAIKNKKYSCFLEKDTVLPMMYMPDAIRGTIQLAQANYNDLTDHSNFNFAGISFSCEQLADNIKKYIPEFEIEYNPDFRQKIANTWPQSIDDSNAKKQWQWKPEYNLDTMVKDMIEKISDKYQNKKI